MEKPIKKAPIKEMYNYNEVIDYIEKKYNIITRNMGKGMEGTTNFGEWCDSKGYGKKDPEGKDRGSSQIWYAEWKKDLEAGIVKEEPYLDFWHWVIEQDDEIRNGSKGWISIEALEGNDYWNGEVPEWVKGILQLIKDEGFFDEEGFTFWVEW